MTVIYALLLGLVEGITEFLPISSTAHLIITSRILRISQTEFQKFFEVFIQSGAILAVVIIYFQYLLEHRGIFKKLLFSFIPTAIIGFLLYRVIKNIFFESNLLIIIAIFSIGVLFLIIEQLINNKKLILDKSINSLNWQEALIIGLGQSLSIIPGVSRAGSVMVTMMFMRYKRDEAATYSFLLAVPTIMAASIYDLYKMREFVISAQSNLIFIIIGFVTSFITAYIVIKWFINFLKNNTLVVFGIYRVLLAIILLQVPV